MDLAIDYQNNIISKRERDVQQSMRTSQVFISTKNLFQYQNFVFLRVPILHYLKSVN